MSLTSEIVPMANDLSDTGHDFLCKANRTDCDIRNSNSDDYNHNKSNKYFIVRWREAR